MNDIGTLAEKRAYKDKEAMIDAEEEARQDALEAKWTAYEERAKQILADELFRVAQTTLKDEYFNNPADPIIDNGDYMEYSEAIAARNWPEVGRIQGRAFETIARKLAESETFADRLAEIVDELDEDARHE